jgi:tyrosyl-tRNA synthetase
MEKLHKIKECLIDCVANQVENHLDCVNTKELGEAIDMIKDISKAMYYFTITEAMENGPETHKKQREYYPDVWETYSTHSGGERSSGAEMMKSRKNYIDGKTMHHDKSKLMQDLESYMAELSKDMVEMVQDMSMEEKQMLQQKLQILAAKIK